MRCHGEMGGFPESTNSHKCPGGLCKAEAEGREGGREGGDYFKSDLRWGNCSWVPCVVTDKPPGLEKLSNKATREYSTNSHKCGIVQG